MSQEIYEQIWDMNMKEVDTRPVRQRVFRLGQKLLDVAVKVVAGGEAGV